MENIPKIKENLQLIKNYKKIWNQIIKNINKKSIESQQVLNQMRLMWLKN